MSTYGDHGPTYGDWGVLYGDEPTTIPTIDDLCWEVATGDRWSARLGECQ